MENQLTVEIFGENHPVGYVLEKLGTRQAEHEEKIKDLQALLPLLQHLRRADELIGGLVFKHQGALEAIHVALTKILALPPERKAEADEEICRAIGEIEELKRLFEK